MRSIIEEYCSLPFIKRERIYRKEIYETIERACTEKRILKIKAEEEEKDKIVASFSMARINAPTMLIKTFHLNKQEIANFRITFH